MTAIDNKTKNTVPAINQLQFKFLVDSTPDAVILVDEQKRIIFWNKAAEDMFGYSPDEMLGKDPSLLLPQTKRMDDIKGAEQRFQTGASPSLGKIFESTGLKKNGETFPTEVSLSMYHIGTERYFSGIIRDISIRKKLQNALADSEQRTRLLLDNSLDIIFTVDTGGIIRYVSPSSERILGYCLENVRALDFVHPDDLDAAANALAASFKNPGAVHCVTCRCKHKDGSWRILQSMGKTVISDSGELLLIVNARDVTDQKHIEDALKDSEERFRALAKSASDAIICMDSAGSITFWNDAAESAFLYSAQEILARPITTLIPERYHELYQAGMERVISSGEFDIGRIAFEFVGLRKDGTEFPAELSFACWQSQDETFFSCIVRDITERKGAEDALNQEKEFSRAIIETADVSIIAMNMQGKVILFNKKAEEITGYSRDEVLGKDLFMTLAMRMDQDVVNRMFKEVLQGGAVTPYHAFITTKTGVERVLFTRGTQLKDKQGNIFGVLETGTDVTEQRSMEAKLLQAEKLRGLGELASGVAHDFNNVLAAILGRAQLLKVHLNNFAGPERRQLHVDFRQGLEVIERAARDGAETVRRIQEFARIRPDDKDAVSIDLNEVVGHAFDFTRTRWKDEAQRQGINVTVEQDLAPVPTILGSPSELREVFTNLINNSLDAMPGGGTIRVRTYTEGTHVCLKHEDTGTGMPSHVMERMFDPFFTTKGPQSTGLGMNVSYGIITRHQGTIAVESKEGSGTTFLITFPIHEQTRPCAPEERETPEMTTQARILVVEDESDVRNLIYDILTMNGHDVTVAKDGREGVESFMQGRFNLVLTDLGLPGLSGWDVASAVKKHNPGVVVAILTGWGIQLDEVDLKKSGANFILNKPFTMDELLRVVNDALALKNGT